jgi:outer membrane protein assembly factor BamD (BamD/ComL family)
VDSLIKEGSRCIEERKYEDALQLFEEAHTLEKWRDIYGPLVLANLAYICVMKKNYLRARQFVDDYISMYGSSDLAIDPDEHFKITQA